MPANSPYLLYAGCLIAIIFFAYGVTRVRQHFNRYRQSDSEVFADSRAQAIGPPSAAQNEFLANICHEIRNPMNGIIGLAESIKAERLDADSHRKLKLLRQCAGHLASLLDDILDYSSLQAEKIKLEPRPFDLPELMETVIALTAAESEKRSIPIEIAISPAVPRQLIGDPRRIRQILLNFTINALKYSTAGKISITGWRNKTTDGANEICFAVCDEGPGIAPEEQAKLFTRFERGGIAATGQIPGTGLGLALCKTLAEKMGGNVWLKSEAGQGACFYFSAPFQDAYSGENNRPSTTSSVHTKVKSALVVDDQEYNCVVLTELLKNLGISVRSVETAEETLTLARSQTFDFIFLDYSISGLNGPEIARAIRALPEHLNRAIIVATTAFAAAEKRSECLAAGMDAFITKPVTMDGLRDALGAALGKNTAVATLSPSHCSDQLAKLRLLAAKKHISLSQELTHYFLDFEAELKQLTAALQQEDSVRASYYAHLLYGRCSFIHERNLDVALRQLEENAVSNRWTEARQIGEAVQSQLNALRTRMFSEHQTAQPA